MFTLPLRTPERAVRGALAALAFVAAVGCFIVFEAAFKTDLALRGAEAAQTTTDRATRDGLLLDADRFLTESWANPLAWHAGANEAKSYIAAALAADTHDPEMERAAVASATRAVDLSPVQPAAWARLAAFAQVGRPVERCAVPVCLDRSWRSAPLTNPGIECARMRIAHRIGELPPGDARFAALDRSMDSTRDFAQCLSFLPREELFRVLMTRAANQQAERDRHAAD